MFILLNKYYLMAFFATLIWGAAYPFTKHLISILPINLVIFIRSLVSSFFLLLYVKPRIKKLLDFKFFLKIFLMSIIGVIFQQYIQAYALKMTSSINAGFLITLTPIVVVIIEVFMGDCLTFNKIVSFVFGIVGTIIVSYSSGKLSLSSLSSFGDFLFVFSVFSWAVYVVLTKRWFIGDSQIEITTYTMLVSLLILTPFVLNINILTELLKLDKIGWISVFYLCFLSSCLGYVFWNLSIENLTPTKVSYFIYNQPFAAIISAYVVNGEKVNIISVIGGLLIFLGGNFIVKEKN